jgi:outer membrane receptor protein involved in Fe transport
MKKRAGCLLTAFPLVVFGHAALADAPTDADQIPEIVVTAQKRTENLQSVPVSITTFGSRELKERAVENFMDYATSVPNLGFGASGDGAANSRTISIRGVSGDNTTGFYLDETPLPDSLDPRIIDIDHIEVLRGPQGTLYGARSMGGTVRLLTNQPDTKDFSASVHTGVSSTEHTDAPNYMADGIVNLPLIQDTLGLRMVGFFDREAGFFKRQFPTTPGGAALSTVNDVGRSVVQGGSLALVLKINDALTVTPRILHQETAYNGFPFADGTATSFSPTNFIQSRTFNVPEGGSDRWTLYSLGVHYTLPLGELVSSTSYFDREIIEREDESEVVSLFFYTPAGLPPVESQITEIKPLHRFVQELRFASQLQGPWQFVLGTYFSATNGQFTPGLYPPTIVPGLTAVSGYPGNLFFYQNYPSTIREPAIFGELSYQATSRLKLTAGARWYEIKSTASGTEQGAAVGVVVTDSASTLTEVGVNPKVQADYRINNDAMVYATAAKGFRPGGIVPTVPSAAALGCPAQLAALGLTTQQTHEYQSDSLWNYELGTKTSWLDNRLTVNADVFYIDWKNIQQQILLSCGFQFRTNAGAAKSEGGELEVHARPLRGLDISSGVGYQHAVITKAGAGGTASPLQPGDRVYQVPDWTANTAVTYTTALSSRLNLVNNLTYSYVGDSKSANNDPFDPRTRAPYALLDARFALAFSQYEIAFVGKNLTNDHANLADNRSIAVELPGRPRIVTNQPITFGIEFRATFK